MDLETLKGLGDVGAIGLMFLAYLILLRSTFEMLQKLVNSMNDNFAAALSEQKNTVQNVISSFERLNAHQREAEERSYEVLKSLAEDLKILVANVGRVEMKVDNLESHLEIRRYSK